ncbi:DUF2125 domain-containing protein [Sneathiella marina]|uniref:DUF2125 domain-containing protein n=1 Tax=Sneathiella marina TaxID=2950108 RepID=A0ABY4W1K0_9PROT|nr:DUF2125 domain-containing protein [Sneathiella marina]USG61077.1 DUF2125 domain-containing protein [Sneathiella marina]
MRGLYLGIIALLLVIGGYVFWWFHVADTMVNLAENWKQQRLAEGYEISHKPFVTSGFPYRVRITAEELSLSNPTHYQKPDIKIDTLWAVAQPWQVNHIIFGVEGSMVGTWIDGEELRNLEFLAETALGSATFNLQGRMQTLALDLAHVIATPSWRPLLTADRLQIHGRPAPAANENSTKIGQQIAVRIDGMIVEGMDNFPLGNSIQQIAISSILEGTIEKLPSEASLTKWREEGGFIDIKALDIQWGQGIVRGNGRVALDEADRPTGMLQTQILGYENILEALTTTGKIDPNAARMIGFALSQLSTKDAQGRNFIKMPLSAQQGGVYLGPIYLAPVAPLF